MIRLLIIDDHPVVSDGLARRYADLGFEVVSTASTIAEALRLTRTLAVDVALVDVQLEVLLTPRNVAQLAERCRVVLYSAESRSPWIPVLLAAGAVTAVDKAAPLEKLDRVLREVHTGQRAPLPPAPRNTLIVRDRLTAREDEVFRALARFNTPKEVAHALGIARSTVYCHIERVKQKLGVETVQELIARALVDRD